MAAEEYFESQGSQTTMVPDIAESDAKAWEDLARQAVVILHKLHGSPIPADPLKEWRDRKAIAPRDRTPADPKN